jgi:N-carbamoylputrescine amidase
MKRLAVTVCQLQSDGGELDTAWEALKEHVRREGSDLVVLPEMPFYPWPFWRRSFSADLWQEAISAHARWLERLPELNASYVIASHPVTRGGQRLNEGFVWEREDGLLRAHDKFYLPDEDLFWEASWYERGSGEFVPATAGPAQVGFLICTELWFMQQARHYGAAGAHLLVTPRATEKRTIDRWLVAGRAAAIIAGAYSLSSNHFTLGTEPVPLGGCGWIIDPEGTVLGITTPQQPFLTRTLDLSAAETAKSTYPRYVRN